eukprot:TRINITY_DN8403_c0_g1_i2.p1 TRINITY_DN8403_c0_g1~~TRINITY_DN8403_c0_g1_i2.p1  ORF type:complete len:268 (-),score=42.55 TRINITY_DN8403_c0_g1_i2:50-853(-)
MITKVADFGLSHVKQETGNKRYAVGQIPWMAPEVLKDEALYTEAADVYSFGCVLYELWTGKEPHWGYEPSKYGALVQEGYRPDLPFTVPARWKELIQRCMHQEAAERMPFREILEYLDSMSDISSTTSSNGYINNGISLSPPGSGNGSHSSPRSSGGSHNSSLTNSPFTSANNSGNSASGSAGHSGNNTHVLHSNHNTHDTSSYLDDPPQPPFTIAGPPASGTGWAPNSFPDASGWAAPSFHFLAGVPVTPPRSSGGGSNEPCYLDQ